MKIIANIDYIQGHLRYGHYELDLNEEEYYNYKKLSDEDRIDYIEDEGKLIIDDYYVDDIGTITKIIETYDGAI